MPNRLEVDRVFGTILSYISIQIADGSQQNISAGTYVAERQDKQQPGTYQLYEVDSNGQRGDYVATVHLNMRSNGVIEIG